MAFNHSLSTIELGFVALIAYFQGSALASPQRALRSARCEARIL